MHDIYSGVYDDAKQRLLGCPKPKRSTKRGAVGPRDGSPHRRMDRFVIRPQGILSLSTQGVGRVTGWPVLDAEAVRRAVLCG
jgi:hypothetical protein